MTNFEILKNKLQNTPHRIIELNAKSLSVDDHVAALNLQFNQGMSTLIFKTKKGEYFAVLRRDDRNIDLKKLKEILNGQKFSFCSQEDLKILGFEPGLASPFILNDLQKDHTVKIFIDKYVTEMDKIVCGSTSPNHAVEILKDDLFTAIGEYEIIDTTIPNNSRSDVTINLNTNNQKEIQMKKRILTGDRPTGKLHVGHLIGSLQNRVKLQHEYEEYVLLANVQAFTDNFDNPEKVLKSIPEILADYYAVGIDFNVAKVIIQSEIPEIHEIFMYLANFSTVQQIAHNPTIKTEILEKKYGDSTPLGFYMYPIHQIADIACVKADLVPVGPDQVPIVEDCREVIRKFNRTYKTNALVEPQSLVGITKNVPGIDSNSKMGKSLGNAIYLNDTEEELKKKVFSMKTDPNRIHATDPGKVEDNTVFTYHDIFNNNVEEVNDLKERYRLGTVSDMAVKEKLFNAMNEVLTPIREKRLEGDKKVKELMEIAKQNSLEARKIAREVADNMKEAMLLNY